MRRFPVGLTFAAALGVAILVGLGVWQLHRLTWKRSLIAKVIALQHARATAIGPVLEKARQGADVGFMRVEARCTAPAAPYGGAAPIFRYALRDGRVGWRLMDACALQAGPWSAIALDRGLVAAFAGRMAPSARAFPPPVEVVGVLRAPGVRSFLDAAPQRQADGAVVLQALDPAALRLIAGAGAAPYYLAVEREAPAPAGVTPAALPSDIPNNHFVYALTWFGLAGVLAWMWAGFVLTRGRRGAP